MQYRLDYLNDLPNVSLLDHSTRNAYGRGIARNVSCNYATRADNRPCPDPLARKNVYTGSQRDSFLKD